MSILLAMPGITLPDDLEARIDAAGYDHAQIDNSRLRLMAARIDGLLVNHADRIPTVVRNRLDGYRRTDAVPTAGYFLAQQLEYIYQEVVRTPQPKPSAFEAFAQDNRVPVGARSHKVRRVTHVGEATIYGGEADVPSVGVRQEEEAFPVVHLVTKMRLNLFDMLSDSFANGGLIREQMDACRMAITQKMNALSWSGDRKAKLYGALNYPWVPVKLSATPFSSSSTADQILAELNACANYASENSQDILKPDTLAIAPALDNYISQTPRSSTSDKTIKQYWLETNPMGIKRVVRVPELKANTYSGPNFPANRHGMLFYNSAKEATSNTIVTMFQLLPPQSDGFFDTTYAYGSYGGIVYRMAGASLIAWVQA